MSDHNEPRRVPARKPGDPSPPGQAKPTGNSMKDRLLAERRAAEAAAASGARPAPAKPGVSPARPAGARPGAPKPVGTPPKAPLAGKPGARPVRPTRAARATAGGEEGGGRRHGAREPKKKSVVPIVATGLVLVVGAVGAYFAIQMMDEGEAGDGTGKTVAAAGTPADVSATEAGESEDATDTPTTDGSDDPAAAGAAALDPEEKAALKATQSLPSSKDLDSWNVIAITKNPNQVNDPNGVDLTKITPYGKPPGVAAEEWGKLVADAKTMFDPLSGVQGNRAEVRLLAAGLNAWPAVTNEMLTLDPRRPDDNRTGKRAEVLLDNIRGGTTGGGFNWRMPATSDGDLERRDLFYNLQLIVELHDVWRRHLAAPDRYFREKIAKGTVQAEMKGEAPPDEVDEINVDELDLSEFGGG